MTIYHRLIPGQLRRSIRKQVLDTYRERVAPTPGRIVIAGWQGSGSTFVYQVAGLLGLDVLKIHGKWTHERMERILFTIRDPRDIICNRAQRANREMWAAGKHEDALLDSVDYFAQGSFISDLNSSLAQVHTTIIRYETFFGGNEGLLIRWLADQFMVPLDAHTLQEIMSKTSIAANQARAARFDDFSSYDDETQIHGQHITNRGQPGAWQVWFTPLVSAAAKAKLGEALIWLGYEKDLGWSAQD